MTILELVSIVSCLLGMLVTVGSLIKPIINLNTSITRLNDTVFSLQCDMQSYKNDARTFSKAITDLQTKVSVITEQIKVANHRLEDLEGEMQNV